MSVSVCTCGRAATVVCWWLHPPSTEKPAWSRDGRGGGGRERETERLGETETHGETDRQRETERLRETETHGRRERDIQTETERHTQRDRNRERERLEH